MERGFAFGPPIHTQKGDTLMSTEAKSFAVILAELVKPFDPAAVEFKPGAVAKNEARALALA